MRNHELLSGWLALEELLEPHCPFMTGTVRVPPAGTGLPKVQPVRLDAVGVGVGVMDMSSLDPGVRELVAYLRFNGFVTTDSGDGVSKAELIAVGEALDTPHVFMTVATNTMVAEADRLLALLQQDGVNLDGVSIEASYSPLDGRAVVLLLGLNDEKLKHLRLGE